jgi:hypothetical protein
MKTTSFPLFAPLRNENDVIPQVHSQVHSQSAARQTARPRDLYGPCYT